MKLFENEHRSGADDCAINAKDYQNSSISDYNMWNTYHNFPCDHSGDSEREEFATTNLNLRYRNGYGFTSGCYVDDDTEVRLNGKLTHERPKTQMFPRSFVAVPDLSKGIVLPGLESPLIQGEDTSQLRECHRLAETNFDRFVPLVPCLADKVQNVKYIVEPWTHGGESSRLMMRNSAVLKKCGYKDNGNWWSKPKQ